MAATGAEILIILMAIAVPLAILFLPIAAIVILIVAIRRSNKRGEKTRRDERAVQNLRASLQRMEARIQNIETVLMRKEGDQ